ncbi:MAG: SIS domain-containing protein [Kiritimatiellia bacterium]|jgi:D-sedoheptulose 7-phosphate isomerase|nr:SIS domain-containing protein [Kiritimatiellia bacterium]MDP6809159.1 SIS domain-containing protein [Kiritimatiellia bacterium]
MGEDKSWIRDGIAASAAMIGGLVESVDVIGEMGEVIVAALKAGSKVLTAGNGGSAADALHMSEEFVGRFRNNRCSLPAVSLAADSTAITCIGNDFGFDEIFSRQVEGLGKAGDVLVVFSTSGSARNLSRAIEAAREAKLITIALLGRDGGPLAGKADHEIIVRGDATERIQEAHQVLVHLLLDAAERVFWSNDAT